VEIFLQKPKARSWHSDPAIQKFVHQKPIEGMTMHTGQLKKAEKCPVKSPGAETRSGAGREFRGRSFKARGSG